MPERLAAKSIRVTTSRAHVIVEGKEQNRLAIHDNKDRMTRISRNEAAAFPERRTAEKILIASRHRSHRTVVILHVEFLIRSVEYNRSIEQLRLHVGERIFAA